MRAGLAVLIPLLIVSPASACRLHSIWHYPFPERCPVLALASRPKPLLARPVTPAVWRWEETIPLPDLGDIQWGQTADEATVGRVLLRAKLESHL